jgi:c-di-GMP-binding flagellar brake protein YcgR
MEPEKKGTKSRAGIVNLERRKYPRFSVNLPVEYHHIDSAINHAGRARNASEGGFLVYFPEPMKIGQRLSMKLFFSLESGLDTIEVLAEVVWMDIHLSEGWGDYRSGVRFIDISPENLRKLKNILTSFSQ